MKNFYLLILSLVLVMLAAMFITDFLPVCDQGRGTGMDCSMSVGMQADVDSPARIQFFSFDPFRISQLVDGQFVSAQVLNLNGFYQAEFTTNGPSTWLMQDERGGISSPTIRVDTLGSQYPSLVVHRTWHYPLAQLIKWNLFPIFLMMSIWFIWALISLIKSLRK